MDSTKYDRLTDRQTEVLAFILDFIRRNGFPPSYREIGGHFGVSLNGVVAHLKALQRKGYLELPSGAARSLKLTSLARFGCDKSEHDVLVTLARLCLARGRMPTYCELAEALAVDEMTVAQQLQHLKDLGYIDWSPRGARSFRFLTAAWPALSCLA